MNETFRLLTRQEIEAVPGMQDPIPGACSRSAWWTRRA